MGPVSDTEGTARPIVQVGDPVLARTCQPVTDYGEDLQSLLADMWASMAAAEGVGLAANQIGVDRAVFIYDCPDADGAYHKGVVCNPVLLLPEGEDRVLDEGEEGCLSVRGQFTSLARPDAAAVTGSDQNGEPITVTGTGLLARCLQHETDHLNGMLYIDRLPRKTRKQVLAAWAAQHPPDGGAPLP